MFDFPSISWAIGGVATTMILFWIIIKNQSPLACPNCDQEQPKFRKPKTFHQLMWGGNTCKACGTEIDRNGQLRETR